MGAKLFKETFIFDDQETVSKSILVDEKEKEFLSPVNFDTEFNKLYLNTRDKLHAIAGNPSGEILNTISQSFKQNSKFLGICFNEIKFYEYNIVDMVTERLTYNENVYKFPNPECKHVDSFINTNSKYTYEKQQQP